MIAASFRRSLERITGRTGRSTMPLIAMAGVGLMWGHPVLLGPFAASVILVAWQPDAPASRSSAIAIGYLIGSILGVIAGVAAHFGGSVVAAAVVCITTPLSASLMARWGTIHMPATAMPALLAASGLPTWTLVAQLVLATALTAGAALMPVSLTAPAGTAPAPRLE